MVVELFITVVSSVLKIDETFDGIIKEVDTEKTIGETDDDDLPF